MWDIQRQVIAEPPSTQTVDYTNDKLMWDGGELIFRPVTLRPRDFNLLYSLRNTSRAHSEVLLRVDEADGRGLQVSGRPC